MPRSKWLEGKIRALRNKARRKALRDGLAKVGDGSVVNHKGAGFKNVTTQEEAQKVAAGPKGRQDKSDSGRDGQEVMVEKRFKNTGSKKA